LPASEEEKEMKSWSMQKGGTKHHLAGEKSLAMKRGNVSPLSGGNIFYHI
jgi:hypothetical protein